MRRPDADFWRGRRVLLTGHTGFKGAWIAAWLHELGAEVTGLALDPPTEPSLFDAAGIASLLDDRRADIRDPVAVTSEVTRADPEIVLHLAAQSLVRHAYAEPVETYATNVMGTVHTLEAVRRADNVRAVVCVTSDKCYRNREWEWPYRESDELGGHDPYSSSKACAELATAAYRDSFLRTAGIAAASARAGNVIGGGDWSPDRLVPDLVRAFMAGRPCRIRYPDAVRPWQHVLEPLSGYLLLAERLHAEGDAWTGGWNFGPVEADNRPVSWIADRAAAAWGSGTAWEAESAVHPHEAGVLRLDWSQARYRLNWRPAWKIDQTIQRTIHLYQLLGTNPAPADVRAAMLEDIRAWSSAIDYDPD